MRARFLLTATLLAPALLLPGRGQAGTPPALPANLGKQIANLTFTDAAGKSLRLYDLKEQKAILLVFLSFDCPVSNSYSQPLADLHNQYHKYGVTVLGLTTNQDQTRAEVARQARHFNLPFPVYLDRGFVAADALKAAMTPTAFLLDGNYTLRYRGRIDDAWADRLKPSHKATTNDLLQALAELLSGRPVSNPVTHPVGCALARDEPSPVKAGAVTYYHDVLPIVQQRCQQCHRPGEVGPFSLMTYRQAVNWAQDIKDYTRLRQMPPWKITQGVAFHNDRRMPEHEIATLAAWADGGTPKGDPNDAPPPRRFPEGWQLGQPDLVLMVPGDFQLGPTGRDVFRCFVLPTGLTEDRYIAAVEVRPSNPRIVHHTLQFIDSTGQARKLEQRAQSKKEDVDPHGQPVLDRGPGYSVQMGVGFLPQGGLGGWVPGQMPRFLPDGLGYFLPRGSDVVMQVHYHRNGRLEKDRTQVGLYFAKAKEGRRIQGGTLFGSQGGTGPLRLFFSIPAGADHFKLKGRQWATDDFTLYVITPHMHLLGKGIKVTSTPPGGPTTTILEISDWDYNWQETYHLKEPLRITTGTRLDVEAVYDNSDSNSNNPYSPPRRVSFGEQTTNEMCFVFLGGRSAHAGRRLPLTLNEPGKTARPAAAAP